MVKLKLSEKTSNMTHLKVRCQDKNEGITSVKCTSYHYNISFNPSKTTRRLVDFLFIDSFCLKLLFIGLNK